MLKFFYRLKKRRGVVLFAVIGIMTLLIVMASVAYFTARSSYQTVVSNYDFSQTYLSATSVADMMLAAVAYDTSTDTNNDYTELRTLIENLEGNTLNDIILEDKKCEDAEEDLDIDKIYYRDDNGAMKKTVYYNKVVNPDAQESDQVKYRNISLSEDQLKSLEKARTISGSSNNIDKKTGSDLIDASMNDPVKGGILDACEVQISLDRVDVVDTSDTPPEGEDEGEDDGSGKYSSLRYFYTFTTTAYYRGNSISVQDTVYHDVSPGGKPGLPQFDTFFTATGQYLKSSGEKGYPGDRTVVINSKLISDNAYFRNTNTVMTCISGTSAFDFRGGVQTAGNLYITSDLTGNLPKPENERRHDWIIGGDLFITGNGTVDFNGNCLYVKGDLIIGSSSKTFLNLGSCVVEGNIYILNGSREYFNGGFADYNSLGIADDYQVKPQGLFVGQGVHIVKPGDADMTAYVNDISAKMTDTMNRSTLFSGDYTVPTGSWGDAGCFNVFNSIPMYYNSTIDQDIDGYSLPKAQDTFTEALENLNYSKIVLNEDGSKYKYELHDVDSVSDLFSQYRDNLEDIDGKLFDSYSAGAETFKNVIEIDMSTYNKKAGGTQVVSTADSVADVTLELGDRYAELTLPFVPEGYVLKFINPTTSYTEEYYDYTYVHKPKPENYWNYEPIGWTTRTVTTLNAPFSFNAMDEWRINICTGSWEKSINGETKTVNAMPIVLTANFNDGKNEWDPSEQKYGTPVDSNDYNSFSWKFGDTGNDCATLVRLMNTDGTASADDYVIFEMGNYTPKVEGDDDTGKYTPFEKAKTDSLEQVIYYSAQKQCVGTKNQVDELCSVTNNFQNKPEESSFDDFFEDKDSGTGILKSTLSNKLMLVSNKNRGKMAYCTGNFDNTTLCGYVYAPNGNYASNGQNDSFALFGGMIVSDYTIDHNYFLYGMPEPGLIEGLGTALKNITGKDKAASNSWYLEGETLGKNYLG